MGRKRKLRIVDLPAEKAGPIAASHDLACLTEGYELASPSRFWQRKDGSWTARFVYTRPGDPKDKIVLTAKGLVFG